MKKVLAFIFTIILSLSVVNAKSIDFDITDAKILEKNGAVEVSEPVFTSKEITSSIVFKELNDSVTYNVTLKNNDKKEYKLVNVEDNNSNNNITTSYIYDKEEIKPNETVSLNIKIKYNKVLKNVEKKDLDDFNVTLIFENENGEREEIPLTPKTSDNIWIYFILLAISIVGIILVIKKIKGGKVLVMLPLLVLPLAIFGLVQFKINILFKDIEVVGTFDIFNIEIDSDNGEDILTKDIKYGDKVGLLPTPSKAGYTFNGWVDKDGNIVDENTTITEETSLKASYSIIEYNISYNLDGGKANNVTKYTIEDEITLNNPTKAGYTFAGWTEGEDDTLRTSMTINKGSTGDKVFNAHFSTNTNTKYTVIHKQMDMNGEYVEKEREVLEGATDTNVTPQVKVYEGFTSPEEQTITIAGDESSEVTYLYERNKYNLTITNTNYVNSNISSGSYYYETEVTLTAKDRTGYTFTKWSNNLTDKTITFKLKDNTTIGPEYSANTNTKYKVLHKTMDLDGTNYSVYEEINETGTTDTSVTPTVYELEGFNSPEEQTVNIEGDNSTVVTYLYTRQQRTLTINNSNYVETETPSGSYYYDTVITLTAKERVGYTFNRWSTGEVSTTLTFNIRTNTAVEPIYVANTNTKYKVLHKTMNLDGTTYSVYEEINATGTTDTSVTPTVYELEGFNSPEEQTVNINGDGSTVVTYLYTRQQRTLTINNSEYVDTITPSGNYYYGTSITLTAKDRDGYTFTKWSNNNTNNPLTFSLETNTTIGPEYEISGYTVSFDSQGGSSVDSITRNANEAIGTLPTTTRENYNFLGWYTEDGNTKITKDTIVTGTVTYYAHWAPIVCKKATIGDPLHTEECQSNGYCRNTPAYASGGTITYGTYPGDNSPLPGDAYDCDVIGNGTYERFYFVREYKDGSTTDNAVLVYYTSLDENGNKLLDDKTGTAYLYTDAPNSLPDSSMWANENLKTFNGKVSRFPSVDDLDVACGVGAALDAVGKANGYLDSCQFFMEHSRYQSSNLGRAGIWVETYNSKLYRMHTQTRNVATTTNDSVNTVRPVIEIPYNCLEGYQEKVKYTITFNSNGGTEFDSIERYENQVIGSLPVPTKDGYTFEGWFNQDYTVEITSSTPVTGDMTLYAKWEEVEEPLETVFYIPGSCTFNGNKNNVGNITSSSEQGCISTINPSGFDIDYTNVKYIDTKIALFSNDNYEKDFELGFTMDNYVTNDTLVESQSTFVNAKVDNQSENYPGFTIRKNGNRTEFTGRFGSGNNNSFQRNITYTQGTQIKIARISGTLYYSQDGSDWEEIFNTSNYAKRFNLTTWFGAYSDETDLTATGEESNAGRYFLGTLSNIYIKLDIDSEENKKVTFDAHGGTASFTSKEVPKGQAVGELPIANKTGHHFEGWYTEASNGRKIDETEVINSDKTFHAQYKEIHTVTFDAGFGTLSISPNTVEVLHGETLTSLPTAEFTNYIFDGWYDTNNVKIDGTEVINSDVTYHAMYLEKHTVTFNTNGATPATITKDVGHGKPVGALPEVTLTDHTLEGWFTDDTFSTEVTEETIINNDETFIAKWSEGNIVAMIGSEGYESLQDAVAAVPTTGAKTTIRIIQDIEVNESTTIPNTKWVELDIGDHIISTNNSQKNSIFVNNGKLDIINGTIRSTSGYIIENKYNSVLNISGGSFVYDNTTETEKKVIEISGGTVNITGGEFSCNSRAAVINAKGTSSVLNVSGGRIVGSNTVKGQAIYNEGSTTRISGTAYLENNSQTGSQNGRSALTNASGTVIITGGTIISKSNAAVKNSGTMTIGVEDTSIDTTSIVLQGYNYGLEIASGKTVTVYDGIFKGRDTSNTGSKAINDESLVTHDSNTVITHTRETINSVAYDVAYLTEAPQKYRINLNARGGEISESYKDFNLNTSIIETNLPTPTKGVYTFDGWYEDENAETTPVVFPVDIPGTVGSTTYYAKWTYNSNNNIVNFNMTNDVMSTYYNNIGTWKNDNSTFQTNMDNNFNNYNCSACTAPDYQSCPAPASGKTLCDQPLGYDTGMNESVKVYTANGTNKGTLVSYTTSDTGVIYNMIPGETYYWELDSDSNVYGLVKANGNRRNIYSSVRNVRDLGGMSATYTDDQGTHSGTLNYGILFRGSKLSSSSDVTSLSKLGIDEEFDLRGANSEPQVGTYKYKAILNYNFDNTTTDKANFRDAITLVMQDVVAGKHVYFHCAIGTDRTGTLAWFLEGLLGVPYEEKVQDYELSYFYGLLNRHRFHDYLASSNINPRFATMASTYDTNEKIYNWYIDDPDNQASDIDLVKQFRQAMIKTN